MKNLFRRFRDLFAGRRLALPTKWAPVAVLAVALGAGWQARSYATTTVAFTGAVQGGLTGVNTLSGDQTGSSSFGFTFSHNLKAGASTPDIVGDGGYSGSFTCPTGGGTLNLADSTNICKTGATGTIAPAQGYVITALKKLRVLELENTDQTNNVTVTVPASNGLAGLSWIATGVVCVLQPGADALWTFPNGSSTLTAGSNDGLLFTSAAGTPSVKITAVFN